MDTKSSRKLENQQSDKSIMNEQDQEQIDPESRRRKESANMINYPIFPYTISRLIDVHLRLRAKTRRIYPAIPLVCQLYCLLL